MHHGNLKTSSRLKLTRDVLINNGGSATGAQIREITDSLAVHSDIAALRANGIGILPAKQIGKTQKGAKIMLYQLEKINYGFKTYYVGVGEIPRDGACGMEKP